MVATLCQDQALKLVRVHNKVLHLLWLCVFHVPPGGGGGYSGYILVGVCPGTPKRGVLGTGKAQKGGS